MNRFKVNTSTIRELKFLQLDLTLNLLLYPIVTYWHDHVQVPNPRTPSLLGFTETQATLLEKTTSNSTPFLKKDGQATCSAICIHTKVFKKF